MYHQTHITRLHTDASSILLFTHKQNNKCESLFTPPSNNKSEKSDITVNTILDDI